MHLASDRGMSAASTAFVTSPPAGAGRWLPLAVVLAVLIGVPLGAAIGLAWMEFNDGRAVEASAPRWVIPETVRASTSDGVLVKTRVAIDAGDKATLSAINGRMKDIGPVLQGSVASMTRRELAGPDGLQALSDDMANRLDDFLLAERVPAVRSVAIQDLLLTPR